jgi:hypothetical protein
MSFSTSFHRTTFLALVVSAVLVMSAAGTARAGVCKANGAECQTSVSCCQRNCVKSVVKKGKALFGLCCPGGANGLCGTTPAYVDLKTDPNNCGACDASQCLTCVNGTCASTCEDDEVCDQGSCETPTTTTAPPTTTTAAPTTTTVTPTTSTTTTLPACGAAGAIIACTCGDGTPCSTAATFDCTCPTPSCTSKHAECVSFCGAKGAGQLRHHGLHRLHDERTLCDAGMSD